MFPTLPCRSAFDAPARRRGAYALTLALACLALAPHLAHAHAIAGDRVFPATLSVDDPGVGDEADLQFGHQRVP
ncbi:hypothetical protein SB860_37530, partial [Burkholderia sp. SIMBA_019]